uniref:NADH-ubiquinone oxidoreductase chain 4 n=1 Tax=Uroplatus fimbriatus TaxID=402375 RepID=A0A0A1HAL1_9SAUR|nr:NADH dehydrogenase subunit 4 [Uroplatus fimbriatus]BAP90252.1 NADH dehydrogenase subunit 4 [Uroplatus fimbriatus]
MLKVTLATLMLMPTALLLPPKLLFPITTTYSMLITLHTLNWFYNPLTYNYMLLSPLMGLDPISCPLTIMSAWLLPLMIIASQNHTRHEPLSRQRIFIMTCAGLQSALILSFTATTLTLFYIMFEATLLPTLILITRWGGQAERLVAGTYFLFYTLAGSLPFLIALLVLHTNLNHTTILLLSLNMKQTPLSGSNILMWLAMLAALLVKMPLYGLHLWLPKAHVEAPVAGSMILAAVLLKLGGYGLIRLTPSLSPIMQTTYYIPIGLALWGMLMTSLICLRQTDLKAIIAYSSVSHMGLVITATLIQTPWSIPGAMMLMIAHGLTSSMLFCLANVHYERTQTRTLILTRGWGLILPLTTTWWLLSSLMNMALPPTINLLGELTVITALFNWSTLTIFFTGTTTLLTAIYTLYIFLMTQHGKPGKQNPTPPTHTREHLLLSLHLVPLILLAMYPNTLI